MVLEGGFHGRGKGGWYGKLYAGTVRHLLCNPLRFNSTMAMKLTAFIRISLRQPNFQHLEK